MLEMFTGPTFCVMNYTQAHILILSYFVFGNLQITFPSQHTKGRPLALACGCDRVALCHFQLDLHLILCCTYRQASMWSLFGDVFTGSTLYKLVRQRTVQKLNRCTALLQQSPLSTRS